MHASDRTDKNLGKRLRRARQQAGMSQADLAGRLRTTQSTVSRIEKGAEPRRNLTDEIESFIREREVGSIANFDEIIEAVAGSDELAALVRRIIAEA
ncbi:MAG TPA: transcriptional regulator [Hyphomonas sp.]|nr:transcriptional regulator [Hyphomonas sp.]